MQETVLISVKLPLFWLEAELGSLIKGKDERNLRNNIENIFLRDVESD